MPSSRIPADFGVAKTPRWVTSPVERVVLNLGTFTANTTVTAGPRLPFDRAGVIREIHAVGSAIPSDADGTLLLNAIVYDASEAGDDTIVSSQDLETLLAVANQSYELTLATEGTENELTVAAGDSLRFTLVNNSAAIDTNPNVSVVVIFQATAAVS